MIGIIERIDLREKQRDSFDSAQDRLFGAAPAKKAPPGRQDDLVPTPVVILRSETTKDLR